MSFLLFWAFYACHWLTATTQTIAGQGLHFNLTSGSNENYFFRDPTVTAQLLLTSPNATDRLKRLVVALPAGNSGALAYFLPVDPAPADLQFVLVDGTLASTSSAHNNIGIQADILLNYNASLGATIVGAVRAMRDYVEGGGTMHVIFNYTLVHFNSTSAQLYHRNINSTLDASGNEAFRGTGLRFSIPDSSSARLAVEPNEGGLSPDVRFVVPNASSGAVVRVTVTTNETNVVGLEPSALFLEPSAASTPQLRVALQGLADGSEPTSQQVSFLSFQDKFTAGGWRFLTYFGRDSLIALRLLMPLMTSDAIEAGLGAVIERADSTGALCHEETIGDYASFINIMNGHGELGNTPFYDYKMIDTDLLLLPALSHYFLDLPQGRNRANSFFARQATLQNGTYAGILHRIASYNYARALPFFEDQSYRNLLSFKPGQPVGNWRDSNQGTGYGTIPFDVNTALVSASLRAAQRLADEGILGADFTGQARPSPGAVAQVWETGALPLFEVTVARPTAERRLKDYVRAKGLNENLLQTQIGDSGPVSFYALALYANGQPVEVQHSDLGFNLLYGDNIPKLLLERTIEALAPFPRGLLTNIGMVVANPAYDSNGTNIEILDRTAYHGTVVWSFQQALMAAGLARQLNFCTPGDPPILDTYVNAPSTGAPLWCTDAAFIRKLRIAQNRLWESIEGAVDEMYTEVWSWEFENATDAFKVSALSALSGGTESDAIQLWSYGFLGLLRPHE